MKTVFDSILLPGAERLAAKLRSFGIPSAKATADFDGVRVEMDRKEAMDAEYGGKSVVTQAILSVGGRFA